MKKGSMIAWCALSLVGGCANDTAWQSPPRLTAAYVASLPVIDGEGHDDVWKAATTLELPVIGVWGARIGETARVSIKSVYADNYIAFWVRWQDATRDDQGHKPWVWNAEEKSYAQGRQQEDAMALAFELSGPFSADMLSPVDAVWDLWTWKATRSDPVGYALDKTHRYSTTKPEGKSKQYTARNGSPIWIQRPDDAGASTQQSLAAPSEYSADVVPAYALKTPSGSAADVRAKGHWEDGYWTVELLRKLNTGHADDTAFDPTRRYGMAVSLQDRTGDMDKASAVIQLEFDRKE